MGSNSKNFLIISLIFLMLIAGFNILQSEDFQGKSQEINFSDFLTYIEEKQVLEVKFDGKTISGHLKDGSAFYTYGIQYPDLVPSLRESGANIQIIPPDNKMNTVLSIFISWFPMILLAGVWIFFMRQMQVGGGKAMGFGKSKAKLLSESNIKYTFKDVAGIDDAKEELVEIVDFLRDPSKFQRLGGKIPKGCLLVGPPGTGKTLLAKAIAGEANVPFFSISGSDFVEMFVGVGASRVRDMFEQGKRNAPCIIFIDEIDAVGRHRGIGIGGGNDEREQTLNQMLVEMDGFESNEGVIIIAATNRPDVLDPALLRPGRFDRQITVSNPDINGREKILKVHLEKIKSSPAVDVRVIARGTPGFSGADLANLVNEGALLAARKNKKIVEMIDLEEAKDKVLMGPERRSMVMGEEEKKLTAYHEAGHALVSIHLVDADPIHKATIIPRGSALGMVMSLPEKDRISRTRAQMKAEIALCMGGRVAEELIFGHDKVTSGAYSDIQAATNQARVMVIHVGLSDKIGPVYYGHSNQGTKADISEDTAKTIDSEVKRIIEEGYSTAKKICMDYANQLELLAQTLLERETLTGDEINELLGIEGKVKEVTIKNVKRKAKKDE
jgi:cell division protease FtsH